MGFEATMKSSATDSQRDIKGVCGQTKGNPLHQEEAMARAPGTNINESVVAARAGRGKGGYDITRDAPSYPRNSDPDLLYYSPHAEPVPYYM